MPRTKRAWAWIGGVWLALVVAGGGATLVLQPDDPSPDDSRVGRPSQPPEPRLTETDDECKDEEREAHRRAEREGKEKYAYFCITGEQGDR